MYEKALKQMGLTDSEIRIYLALLQRGPLTKTPIVKESKISGSKVYEVLHRLIDKGLVSVTIKNNIQQFDAATPLKIKEYLHQKKDEISKMEDEVDQVLPALLRMKEAKYVQPDIAVFYGWEGLATVYEEELDKVKRGERIYVIGASTGGNSFQTELFFTKYVKMASERGLFVQVILNTTAKKYIQRIEKNVGRQYERRFLFKKTPTEVTIIGNTTFITLLHHEPTIIRIKNKETADSFKQYFEVLWERAKA